MPTTAEQRFARRKEDAIGKVQWRLASHHPESVVSMIKEVETKLHGSTPVVRNTAMEGVLRAAAEEIVNQVQKDLGLGATRIIYKAKKRSGGGGAGRPPGVLHWTQKPENKKRVKAALRKANKAKAAKKAGA